MTSPRSAGTERPGLRLAVLAATQFLLVMDSAVVNVALASVGRDLGFAPADLTWVVNGYVLAFGGLLLLGGSLADILGARRVLLVGLAVFASASLAGSLAPGPVSLVAARAVQGAGAALAAPALLALVIATTRAGAERNRAIAVLGAMAGSGGAAGLLLGGALTQLLGWRSVLWINVPVVAVIIAGALRSLPAGGGRAGKTGFDLCGAALATAGLSVLVYAVVETAEQGWLSAGTVAIASAAVALLSGFVVREHRAAQPLLPPGFFRRGGTGTANLVAALTMMAMFPMWFLLALQAQTVLGYSPLRTGLAILPLVVVLVVMNGVAPSVLARFGTRGPIVVGLGLASAGLSWFGRFSSDGAYLTEWVGPSLVTGVGFGLAFAAGIVFATSAVPTAEAGLASGVVSTFQQVGGAVGLALALSIATSAAGPGGGPVELTSGNAGGLAAAAGFALLGAVAAAVGGRTRTASGQAASTERHSGSTSTTRVP